MREAKTREQTLEQVMLLLWFQRREEIIRLAGASARAPSGRSRGIERETRRRRREGSQETKIASRNGAIRVEEDIARDTPAQS
jgi:hypothetical protein